MEIDTLCWGVLVYFTSVALFIPLAVWLNTRPKQKNQDQDLPD
jgi:hypothetical protein